MAHVAVDGSNDHSDDSRFSERCAELVIHTERVRNIALVGLLVVAGCGNSAESATTTPTSRPTLTSKPPQAVAPVDVRSGASWADVVTAVRPSVVRIENSTCDRTAFVGSGFAIGDWIVTNRHVVEGFAKLTVRIGDTRSAVPTQVLVSATDDLALIKVSEDLPRLSWTSSVPRVADEVAALGFPEAIGFSFAKGSVSALDVSLNYPGERIEGLLQTDTAVNFGNSGGPLINRRGEVVGVVVLTLSNTEGLAFAIDAPRARTFLSGQQGRPLAACIPRPDASVAPASSVPPAAGLSEAEKVVRAFYAAVDAGDYATAWAIGGRNFVKNSTFRRFAAGFETTESSQLLVLDAVGDVVTVQVTAREQVGGGARISVYRGTYLVRGGEIRSAGLKLHSRRTVPVR